VENKQNIEHNKLLEAVQNLPPKQRSVLDGCRLALIELHKKFYTQREMAELLNANGIEISQPAISQYLKRHPFTKDELKEIEKDLIKPIKTKQTKKKEQNSQTSDEFWKKPQQQKEQNKKFEVNLDKPFD